MKNKPAKKAKTVKVKVEPVLDLWKFGNELEELSIAVSQVRSLLSLTAETFFEEDASNCVWLAYDLLKKIDDDLLAKSEEITKYNATLVNAKTDW